MCWTKGYIHHGAPARDEGLGHAILTGQSLIGNEPFGVLLSMIYA